MNGSAAVQNLELSAIKPELTISTVYSHYQDILCERTLNENVFMTFEV